MNPWSPATGQGRSPLVINAPLKGSQTCKNGRIYSPQVSQNYSMNCPWLNSPPATPSSYSIAQMFLAEQRSSLIFLTSWFLRQHTRGQRSAPIIIKSWEVSKWAFVLGGFLWLAQAAFFLAHCSPHGFNQQNTRLPFPQIVFKLKFWPLHFRQWNLWCLVLVRWL